MKTVLRSVLFCLALVFATAAGVTLAPHPATAQQAQATEPDYEAWARTAARAEDAVAAERASNPAFEQLRLELTNWRQAFEDARQINRNSITTVREQLEALGPLPEDGTEADNIAAQRQLLNERLLQLELPVRTAELAYSEADGLIGGIDRIIRERQAEELLELGPTPLNPVHWLPALEALGELSSQVFSEFVTAWRNPVQQGKTIGDLPAVILLTLVGIVLIVRGRRWSRALTNRVLTDNPGAGRWLFAFMLSLGSMVLPFLGVFALTEAIFASGLAGLHGSQILTILLPSAATYLMARWLATRVFPAKEARTLPLNLNDAQRHAGRWYGASLGAVAGLFRFMRNVADISGWNEAVSNVVLFPLLVLNSILLWKLAALLITHSQNAAEEEGEETYRTRITRLLAFLMKMLAIVALAMAAVGYFNLARWLLFPSMLSLLLLSALLVLQRLVVEIYVVVTRNREGAADSLVPVLIGFVLTLASVPFFALTWGARVADLTEVWDKFVDGVSIGGITISPKIFLTFAIVFVIGYSATRLLQGALKNTVLPKTKMDTGARTAIVSGIGYVGIFLAAVVAITAAGIDLSSIAIVAGALSVGIGFGLQTIVSNFVSGIILLIERPITEGDWIEVGGVHGTVRDISVRATIIETFDRSDVIVPNSDLVSGRVTNYTRGNTVGRVTVPVGVAYGSDTRKVEKILREVAEAHPMVLANPAPAVVFRTFGASSLDFEIRAILRDVNWILSVHSDMNHEIAKRFEEEGIEVPFAQRDIWIRNPEALPGATPQAARPPSAPVQVSEGDMPEAGDGDSDAGDGGAR